MIMLQTLSISAFDVANDRHAAYKAAQDVGAIKTTSRCLSQSTCGVLFTAQLGIVLEESTNYSYVR